MKKTKKRTKRNKLKRDDNETLWEIFNRLHPRGDTAGYQWWCLGIIDERTQRGDYQK